MYRQLLRQHKTMVFECRVHLSLTGCRNVYEEIRLAVFLPNIRDHRSDCCPVSCPSRSSESRAVKRLKDRINIFKVYSSFSLLTRVVCLLPRKHLWVKVPSHTDYNSGTTYDRGSAQTLLNHSNCLDLGSFWFHESQAGKSRQ